MRRSNVNGELALQVSAPQVVGAGLRRLAVVLAVTLTSAFTRTANGQIGLPGPELRPSVGLYLPTGRHDALLERGPMFGAGIALELRPSLHAVFGFGWVATEQRHAPTDRRVELAQFDLGVEWLSHERRGIRRGVSPFVGTGVGLRAYRSRDVQTPSQANVAWYTSLGMEVAAGPVALRLDGRDYVTAFRGLDGSARTSLRNDVMVALGVGLRWQ